MIPKCCFMFDEEEHEIPPDNIESLRFAPQLQCHIHPQDYFTITIHAIEYVGQYIATKSVHQVPSWQKSSGLPCGDTISLFRIVLRNAEVTDYNVKPCFWRVPYNNFDRCLGLVEVHITNAYTWVPLNCITDVAFIAHAETIQNSYLQFGGKGVSNSFFVYSKIRYSIDGDGEMVIASDIINVHEFLSFAPSNFPFSDVMSSSFNNRIFHELGSFKDATNKMMHGRRMFQRNGYRLCHHMSYETWNYLCMRLRGGCTIEDGEVVRVRRMFLSDLAQEKKKFGHERISTISVDTQEQLVCLRRVFGSSFCAGARSAPKLKDGVLKVKLNSIINVVDPPSEVSLKKITRYKKRRSVRLIQKRKSRRVVSRCSCSDDPDNCIVCLDKDSSGSQLTNDELLRCDSKLDSIRIIFDRTTSVAAVTVVFTRHLVSEDQHVIKVLKLIGDSQLAESLSVRELDVGMRFRHVGKTWMVEAIIGKTITSSKVGANEDEPELLVIDRDKIHNLC